jgi:Fe(3+) dicitrate transport protein
MQLFASVYKAFSPALNGDALERPLRTSSWLRSVPVNVEVGCAVANGRLQLRAHRVPHGLRQPDHPGQQQFSEFQVTNGGATWHQGIELGVELELGAGFSLNGNTTWVPDAEFDGARFATNGTITTPDGNRLTYTPEWVANLGLGYTAGSLSAGLNLHHTGEQYSDVLNSDAIRESVTGFFTGRIQSYTLLDLSMVYDASERLSFSGSIKNLTDKRFIASLRQGIYVGPERSIDAGLRYKF